MASLVLLMLTKRERMLKHDHNLLNTLLQRNHALLYHQLPERSLLRKTP
jgi:hypothetical protein